MIPREEVKIIRLQHRSLMIFKGDLNPAQKWEGGTKLSSALIREDLTRNSWAQVRQLGECAALCMLELSQD